MEGGDNMNRNRYENFLKEGVPPKGESPLSLAILEAGMGKWQESHQRVQKIEGKEAEWLHAWLHWQEGDLDNSRYWYARAGREFPQNRVLGEEWQVLLDELLDSSD